ncbi:MAG: NAD-dependent epimerase/dehydratase family protein [Candidatus Omnitrophica bacterium]|nr:NAD-dependent epimerase/dehydratase family protein [Candidatus Omnitrophota bacterium]
MKALVTGGTGFVGSHLVERLSKQGYEVMVLTRKPELSQFFKKNNIHMYSGDLRNKSSLLDIPGHLDYVFHLAATRDSSGKTECYDTNVEGTKNLLEVLCEKRIKLKKFIHVSSLGAAGFGRNGKPKREEDALNPCSFYGETKMQAEKEVIKKKKNIPFVILRPCKIYGPGDKKILLHFKFVKYGIVPDLGLKTRFMSLCYVGDFIEAMILASKSSVTDEIYFVSDNKIYSWEQFYSTIAAVLHKKLRTIYIPQAIMSCFLPLLWIISRLPQPFVSIEPTTVSEIQSRDWTCDPSKYFREFRYNPRVGIEDGLKNTAQWFVENNFI